MRFKKYLTAKTRGAVAAAVFFIAGFLLIAPTQAVSRGMYYASASEVPIKDVIPVVIHSAGNTTSTTAAATTTSVDNSTAASVLAAINYDFSSTNTGVFSGPGAVSKHADFEAWLGKPVPYATDYVGFNSGWSTDFIDSNSWLMKPWGQWASQGKRRLIIGLPMLEGSNAGQFNVGASGSFDSYFKALASSLVANHLGNSVIRLGYEANYSAIGPWQATNNPGGYIQLFRHEVGVMRSVAGSSFLFDWTVCNGLQSGSAINSFASFYPGDDAVDIIGIDIYDMKWQDASASPQTRWDYNMTRPMGVNDLVSFARSHGKKLSYPEWGLYRTGDNFAGGGDDPYFVQKMADLISKTKPLYQSYFDFDWGGGILSDFPKSQTAYKQIFGS